MTAGAKYAVVICPKCRYPRGVQRSSKQGECYHCGHRFKIPGLKIFYETDSESELSEAVGRLMDGPIPHISLSASAGEKNRE